MKICFWGVVSFFDLFGFLVDERVVGCGEELGRLGTLEFGLGGGRQEGN